MPDVLALAPAGLKPDQLADSEHAQYPRVDYLELGRMLDVKVLDYGSYSRLKPGSPLRFVESQVRADVYLAMLGMLQKHRYRTVFTMSEGVGTPFALLNRLFPNRKPLISMFTCWSPRQQAAVTRLKLLPTMNAIAVHCESMKRNLIRLGASASRVHVIPYSVDHCFFSPVGDISQQAGFVLSVGETRSRDYAMLFRAIDGLPVNLLIAPSGRWYSRAQSNSLHADAPSNVTISYGLSLAQLRGLYARSQFVVVPVRESVYSAGATTITEAMCMGRAVIAARSPGILDYVTDSETGILVDPGDATGMREAIQYLLGNPKQARRMGENARRRVEQELNLDVYVGRIARLISSYARSELN